MRNKLSFYCGTGIILSILTLLSLGASAQDRDSNAGVNNKIDSTKITQSTRSDSACRTLDGIPIDGSNGTPQAAPYRGGQWYGSLSAVSAAFGNRPLLPNGGACITNCPPTQNWNGSSCVVMVPTCTPGSVADAAACGTGYNGGTKTRTIATTCPAGIFGAPTLTPSAYDTSSCALCPAAASGFFTPTCAANYTAVVNSGTSSTAYSCATGTAVAGTPVVTFAGTCNLNPATCTPGTSTVACGAGYNGGTKTAPKTCPTAWSAPVIGAYDTTACVACPGSTAGSFTPSCPANYTAVAGSGSNTRSYSCATGTAVAGVPVVTFAGTCNLNPATCTPGTSTVACGAGYNGGTKTASTTCPTAWSAPVAGTYNTASCTACPGAATGVFTPSCPPLYTAVVGSGTTSTPYSCASGSAVAGAATVTFPGTCNANPACTAPLAWNGSACACANGALNATCTIPTYSLCFISGTQVSMKNGVTKAIEMITVDEEVLTFDETTQKQTISKVEKVFHHESKKTTLFTFFYGKDSVTSNDIHPFYLPNENKYQEAAHIYDRWKNGETIGLLTNSSEKEIVNIERIERTEDNVPLYNLHVKSAYDKPGEEEKNIFRNGHNYFANNVLVHNVKWGGCLSVCSDVCDAVYTCSNLAGCSDAGGNSSVTTCPTSAARAALVACMITQPRVCSTF